jgi:hypothetical protein
MTIESNFFYKAISSLAPKAQWFCIDCDYEQLELFSEDIQKPTFEEIEAEIQRLQTECESTEYQRLRAREYPALGDFADAMYWNSKGDSSILEAYFAACEEVKTKYPKPH